MNSRPGRLTGSGVRDLPSGRVDGMLRRIKEQGSGKSRRVSSVRYRVTGFRDPGSGSWISRDPKNGQYYRVGGRPRAGTRWRESGQPARHRNRVRPTGEMIAKTDMISLEVEVDRGGSEPRIYYVSLPGIGAV